MECGSAGGPTAVGDDSLSSRMMSLQICTHSSQMKTVGPAINFWTSDCVLLQNEQRRTDCSGVGIRRRRKRRNILTLLARGYVDAGDFGPIDRGFNETGGAQLRHDFFDGVELRSGALLRDNALLDFQETIS